MDLHAGQVQGFFRIPVDELTAMFPLADYFRAMELIDPVIVAADLGFAKRARNFANMIGGSVAFVEKRRLGNDSSSETLGVIGDVRGRTAIIMDDEIDTAGSITNAAAIVRREGARDVLAACTHAVLSGPAVQRIENSEISTLDLPPTPAGSTRRSGCRGCGSSRSACTSARRSAASTPAARSARCSASGLALYRRPDGLDGSCCASTAAAFAPAIMPTDCVRRWWSRAAAAPEHRSTRVEQFHAFVSRDRRGRRASRVRPSCRALCPKARSSGGRWYTQH